MEMGRHGGKIVTWKIRDETNQVDFAYVENCEKMNKKQKQNRMIQISKTK